MMMMGGTRACYSIDILFDDYFPRAKALALSIFGWRLISAGIWRDAFRHMAKMRRE